MAKVLSGISKSGEYKLRDMMLCHYIVSIYYIDNMEVSVNKGIPKRLVYSGDLGVLVS